MSLVTGTRLGSHEITGPLDSGGMGEVYRARDSKLNRDVALEVLPDLFANDPERLARFQREAQVLASLNREDHLVNFIAYFAQQKLGPPCASVGRVLLFGPGWRRP